MELSTYLTMKEKLTLFGKSTIGNVVTIYRTIYKLSRVPLTKSNLIDTNLLIFNGTILCMRTDANQKRSSVKKNVLVKPGAPSNCTRCKRDPEFSKQSL